MGAKHAVLGWIAGLRAFLQKQFIEFLSLLWICRPKKIRAPPFFAASIEGKLTDYQDFAVYRFQTQVHLPSRIGENAETQQLFA